jgi:exosome complex component RRP45
MHHSPFTFTFAFFPDTAMPPILDPSYLEQRLSTGLLTVALNAQREPCVLQKAGGVPLAPDEILKIVNVAVERTKKLDKLVEARLKEDWLGRNVEVQ